MKHLAKKAKQLAVDTTKVKLTQRQIDAMVAKLSANGLAPGARVFDVNDGPYDDEAGAEAGEVSSRATSAPEERSRAYRP